MIQLSSDLFIQCNNCQHVIHIPRRRLEVEKGEIYREEDGAGGITEPYYRIQGEPHCPSCNEVISYEILASEFPTDFVDESSVSIEGGMFLAEPEFKPVQKRGNPSKREPRLLEHIVSTSDKAYRVAMQNNHPCKECTHDCRHILQGKECNCISCLEEIHYHKEDGRKTYNCPNLANCYACRYSNRYSSEIGYALEELPGLRKFTDFRILSIGCGPAPDLMAFEKYRAKYCPSALLQYKGFDRNPYWWPVHDQIGRYCDRSKGMLVHFYYEDAFDFFAKNGLPESNILVLQYVISHFHNTNQFSQLTDFFERIAESVITKMQHNSVIVIHDINHFQYGRENFQDLIKILEKRGMAGRRYLRYFDNNITNPGQRYGRPYPSSRLLYSPEPHIDRMYFKSSNTCSGASLLIELGGRQS